MQYYVYLLRIAVDRAPYEPHLPAHLRYLDALDAAGTLVLSGPFGDRSGGMVMIRTETAEAARAVAEGDPLVAEGVDTYELKEWRLTGGRLDRLRVG